MTEQELVQEYAKWDAVARGRTRAQAERKAARIVKGRGSDYDYTLRVARHAERSILGAR